jgi:hypothetical protein
VTWEETWWGNNRIEVGFNISNRGFEGVVGIDSGIIEITIDTWELFSIRRT